MYLPRLWVINKRFFANCSGFGLPNDRCEEMLRLLGQKKHSRNSRRFRKNVPQMTFLTKKDKRKRESFMGGNCEHETSSLIDIL